MRGKDQHRQANTAAGGITPAYAGKSSGPACAPARGRDHPRVCGEKPDAATVLPRLMGSPPRMRGKAPAGFVYFCQGGITPAYAGKSWTVSAYKDAYRDHPRVCGEKTKKIP